MIEKTLFYLEYFYLVIQNSLAHAHIYKCMNDVYLKNVPDQQLIYIVNLGVGLLTLFIHVLYLANFVMTGNPGTCYALIIVRFKLFKTLITYNMYSEMVNYVVCMCAGNSQPILIKHSTFQNKK